MVSLEQVKLLESKVSRTIDYVKKVTEENTRLKENLDSYQKRIDELEVLIQRFKDEQSRIEDGILSALDRLNQFEDALERSLSTVKTISTEKTIPAEKKPAPVKPETKPEPTIFSKNKPETPVLEELEEEEPSGPAQKDGELDIF